jgi:hypothetical protein
MMTREPPGSHRWRRRRRRRLLTTAVLAGALLAAGCGYREHEVTAADRKLCDQTARQSARPGTEPYKGIYDACIRNLQHPERGGG